MRKCHNPTPQRARIATGRPKLNDTVQPNLASSVRHIPSRLHRSRCPRGHINVDPPCSYAVPVTAIPKCPVPGRVNWRFRSFRSLDTMSCQWQVLRSNGHPFIRTRRRVLGHTRHSCTGIDEAATGRFPDIRTPAAANVSYHFKWMRTRDPNCR